MAGHVLIVLRSGTITGKNYIAQFVIREYAKNYKTPLKYSRDLASYRRQVASLRRKFREECEEEKREKDKKPLLDSNRIKEVEQEKVALEELAKENERMKLERELLIEQKERESEEKRIKNLAIMKEKQAEQTEMRRQEVANKASISDSFVTNENLDDIIDGIVSNIQPSNYAISQAGKKIAS